MHDAANILRRYLNQLPQPIVPLESYERFRDPLRSHQAQAVGDLEARAEDTGEFDAEAAIVSYQKLITELPALNRQLLLYILDLLAVFASKSEQNRMTSANLAAIFQPGLLSHPNHDMSPAEYRLSQDVLIFLIENQDSFLVGMSGTAADEQTVKDVQSGASKQVTTPTRPTKTKLGRSASDASGGADSLRRVGGAVRRNLSISSKNSRGSGNIPSPGSPAPGSPLVNSTSGGAVYRSNTVPSKRSRRIPSNRFPKANGESDAPDLSNGPSDDHFSAADVRPSTEMKPPQSSEPTLLTSSPKTTPEKPALASVPESKSRNVSRDLSSSEGLSLRSPDHGVTTIITSGTPNKERKSFFSKSPSSDAERKESRLPNKLRKKNRTQTTSNNASAQSSTHSLHGHPESPSSRDPSNHLVKAEAAVDTTVNPPPAISNTEASPRTGQPPQLADIDKASSFHLSHHSGSPAGSPRLKPSRSPVPSIHSRASGAEDSEADHADDGTSKNGKKKTNRWRLSSSSKPVNEINPGPRQGSRLGSSAVAEQSETSLASGDKPKKMETIDSQQTAAGRETSTTAGTQVPSADSTPSKENHGSRDGDEKDKKGPIGWFKAKVAQAKEEREERKAEKEAEKDRGKSPPPTTSEHATSKNSVNALTQETSPPPGGVEGATDAGGATATTGAQEGAQE